MYTWLKKWIERYGLWCTSLGFVEESSCWCVHYHNNLIEQVSDSIHKAQL